MLDYLHIRDLALIEDVELEFSDGINVLTGETGAGKSFILKALGFLLGDKLAADMVRPGAAKAHVEATFTINGEELVLKRELAGTSGRSRFFVNDSVASQESMREWRGKLLSHTSQHAQQQLLSPAVQGKLLEAHMEAPELFAEKENLLDRLREVAEKIESLKSRQTTLAEKRDLLEMRKEEIAKVDPQEGEEEELEEMRVKARAREEARQNYNDAMQILHGDDGPGLLQSLADFERLLRQMCREDKSLENEAESVEIFRQQMTHLAGQFRRPPAQGKKVDMDAIEARLFELAQLKRKLKMTLPQILSLKTEIEQNLSFLDLCALDLASLGREEEKLKNELKTLIEKLKPLRRASADKFAALLEGQLRDLGFSEHLRIVPDFAEYEIWPGIADERGRILWAPNPGQNPQPLDRIASGGELSRFLLGLNTLQSENENLTYIFDEVDAGVGGLTLNKVADKLQNFANEHQVILITHWPKLAAKAQRHFQISKVVRDGNTYTLCTQLDGKERKEELARMAGGGREGKALAQNLLNAVD